MGWMRGFEPPAPRTTIWCSNQLSYIHHTGRAKSLSQPCHKAKYNQRPPWRNPYLRRPMATIRLHPLACAAAGLAFATSPLAAQTALLTENFDGPQVPPPAWTELNNGVSDGWEWRVPGHAFHSDYFGANDNSLVTPPLDFSSLTEAALHGAQGQLFATYRDRNEIEVSIDGGLTFELVHAVDLDSDGLDQPLEVDLSAYVGQPVVLVGFRYVGDYANEWSLDWIVVDDQPAAIPNPWPNLPAAFITMDGYCERFDGLTAGLPDHIAVNSVDEQSRLADADGWCNYGQMADCANSFSGASSLEMGLNPQTTNYHQVANSIIFGLDGSGATNWDLELRVMQMGEEWNDDDGIFLSNDGIQWEPVISDWQHMTGGAQYVGQWQKVTCDLTSTTVDVSGQFYLAVCQADDFPYNSQDGVAIDDFCIGGDVEALRYSITNLVADQKARLTVTGLDPAAFVAILVSLHGAGPSDTIWGMADVGSPFYNIAYVDADSRGQVHLSVKVPRWTQGQTLWSQAVEILDPMARFSPMVTEVVQ